MKILISALLVLQLACDDFNYDEGTDEMALDLSVEYPDNTAVPDANYPYGSARNNSAPKAKDGFGMEKAWINSQEGFFQKLLVEAGIEPSGLADTAVESDYFDALQATPVSLTRLVDGAASVTNGSNTLAMSPSAVGLSDTDAYKTYTSISKSVVQAVATAGTSYRLSTAVIGKGVAHSGGPGNAVNKFSATFSAAAQSVSTDANGVTTIVLQKELTGVPKAGTAYAVNVAVFVGGQQTNLLAPSELIFDNTGTWKKIISFQCSTNLALVSLSDLIITVDFDATGVD